MPGAKDILSSISRYKEAINLICQYIRRNNLQLKIAFKPKPNEPRGNLFLPTVGHALAFINELEYPEMVGVNPEFAHELMSGLSFYYAVAQCLWHNKLFHIDLNAQVPGRYDQDLRFGSEEIKEAFFFGRTYRR
jgi:xylose isomerase